MFTCTYMRVGRRLQLAEAVADTAKARELCTSLESRLAERRELLSSWLNEVSSGQDRVALEKLRWLLQIFETLPPTSLVLCSGVCRLWHAAIVGGTAEKLVWQPLAVAAEKSVLHGHGYHIDKKMPAKMSWRMWWSGLEVTRLLPIHAAAGNLRWIERAMPVATMPELCDKDSNLNALQAAARAGHVDVVRFVLAAGASVDQPIGGWYHSYGSLHIACAAGHTDVASVLLAHKADANKKSSGYESSDPSGWTPFGTAQHHGHTDCMALLLHNGATKSGPGKKSPP